MVALLCAGALSACGQAAHDLTTEQLSAVVDAKRPGLKVCYEQALEKSPYKQDMRMQAILEIAPSGAVKSVSLSGGGGLPGMADCLRAAIRSWRFPTAADPTSTSLPLVFHPEVKPSRPDPEILKQALRAGSARPSAPAAPSNP